MPSTIGRVITALELLDLETHPSAGPVMGFPISSAWENRLNSRYHSIVCLQRLRLLRRCKYVSTINVRMKLRGKASVLSASMLVILRHPLGLKPTAVCESLCLFPSPAPVLLLLPISNSQWKSRFHRPRILKGPCFSVVVR